MTNVLGARSLTNLVGVHPKLIAVVKRAIAISKQDFLVLEGVRTPARQRELYAQGRTKQGRKVTWTLTSNHFKNPKTGYGHAVDLCPFPVDWNTAAKFDAIYRAMMQAALELKTPIRSGMDWDRDGKLREAKETDSPHFELADL
jgi:peptidoglycan L-alanyl-D-glutamate endopeptidase CwlK